MSKPTSATKMLLNDIEDALRDAFPHFQDGADVTPEIIRQIGREYAAMLVERGPQEIEFTDHDGKSQAIIFEKGDSSVGIADGWVLK